MVGHYRLRRGYRLRRWAYHLLRQQTQKGADMIKDYTLWLWDWAKRIFGRSKIVFTNVVGILMAGWVELYDAISLFWKGKKMSARSNLADAVQMLDNSAQSIISAVNGHAAVAGDLPSEIELQAHADKINLIAVNLQAAVNALQVK